MTCCNTNTVKEEGGHPYRIVNPKQMIVLVATHSFVADPCQSEGLSGAGTLACQQRILGRNAPPLRLSKRVQIARCFLECGEIDRTRKN